MHVKGRENSMGIMDMLGEAMGRSIKENKDKFDRTSQTAKKLSAEELEKRIKRENDRVKQMAYGVEYKRRQQHNEE